VTRIIDSDYDTHLGMNWSRLRALRTSPLLFQYESYTSREDKPYYRLGRLAHTIVLEPTRVKDLYVCYDGRRAGKVWDDFQEKHSALTILNRAEWTKAEGVARAVLTNPVAVHHLRAPVEIEVPLTWTDRETGIRCKGRLDFIGRGVVDLKTSARLSVRRFPAKVHELGYHGQLALYHDGASANGYDLAEEPRMIVVDSAPPFDCHVYWLPEHVINAGRELYRHLLRTYADCMLRNSWPGEAPHEIELALPQWAYDETADRDGLELTVGGATLEGL
jgi:hypothetical protein